MIKPAEEGPRPAERGPGHRAREKALLVAETQLAARRRAEQRRIIGEARLGARAGLREPPDCRARSWPRRLATTTTSVSSDLAEFLRGPANCELVKIALREITRKAAVLVRRGVRHACAAERMQMIASGNRSTAWLA